MSRRLVPCPSCRRHVKAAERACPFCALVLVAVSALAGVAVAACDPNTSPPPQAPPSLPEPSGPITTPGSPDTPSVPTLPGADGGGAATNPAPTPAAREPAAVYGGPPPR